MDRSRPPQVGAACEGPASATSRLRRTHFTGCITCTTAAALDAGSESRLLMPVGRAPDVARGPRALRGVPFACTLPLAPAPGIIFPFTPSCRTGEAGRQKQGGAGGLSRLCRGIISDFAALPRNTLSRQLKTHCTGCEACTTGIALDAGSAFRLLMPVGRASDVARGPRAVRGASFACTLPLRPAPGVIFPFTLSCRSGEAGRQKQGGAGEIISPACLSCLFCLFCLFYPPR